MAGYRVALYITVVLAGLILLPCLCGADDTAPVVVPQAADYFNSSEIAQGRSYAGMRRGLFFAGVALQLVVLGLVLWSKAGLQFRLWSSIHAEGRVRVMTALMALGTILLVQVALLPLKFYRGFLMQHRYGLSTQTMGSWFFDWAVTLVLQTLFFTVVVLVIFHFIAKSKAWWWLPAGLFLGCVLVVFYWLGPLVIDPLYNDFEQLRDPVLAAEIRKLAAKAGAPLDEVLVMDASRRTHRANAYYTGLWGTKRIVLYDTLLERFSRDQVLSVVGHELGHWHHSHVAKGVALGVAGILVAFLVTAQLILLFCRRGMFGLNEAADPACLPLMLITLIVLELVALPIGNAISRRFEREADLYTLELTENPAAFIELERKLAHLNLAEIAPPRWAVWALATHPPVLERIGAALSFRLAQQAE